jgi:enterochelin esterase-like enzyme
VRLHSISLAAGRQVTLYVPDSVRPRRRRRYPLLILHDGQNLFDPSRAFVAGQHWRVGEIADELIAARRIPPIIICGFDHGGPDRIREMTPTSGPHGNGGGAIAYTRMLADELLPLVRREFPVEPDRRHVGLGGASLGGLVTLFAATQRPDLFSRLLVMSPSVWWDRRVILNLIAKRPAALAGTRMWVDIGLREGVKAVADARRLVRTLTRLKMPPRAEPPAINYVEDPEGDHSELAWAARLPRALVYLYGDIS